MDGHHRRVSMLMIGTPPVAPSLCCRWLFVLFLMSVAGLTEVMCSGLLWCPCWGDVHIIFLADWLKAVILVWLSLITGVCLQEEENRQRHSWVLFCIFFFFYSPPPVRLTQRLYNLHSVCLRLAFVHFGQTVTYYGCLTDLVWTTYKVSKRLTKLKQKKTFHSDSFEFSDYRLVLFRDFMLAHQCREFDLSDPAAENKLIFR